MDLAKDGYQKGDWDSKTKALLDYVARLTVNPSGMTSEDIDKLRKEGYSDGDILDAVQVASYFNYINRIADGLGVSLEE